MITILTNLVLNTRCAALGFQGLALGTAIAANATRAAVILLSRRLKGPTARRSSVSWPGLIASAAMAPRRI